MKDAVIRKSVFDSVFLCWKNIKFSSIYKEYYEKRIQAAIGLYQFNENIKTSNSKNQIALSAVVSQYTIFINI